VGWLQLSSFGEEIDTEGGPNTETTVEAEAVQPLASVTETE
jgi:hypothetical protein